MENEFIWCWVHQDHQDSRAEGGADQDREGDREDKDQEVIDKTVVEGRWDRDKTVTDQETMTMSGAGKITRESKE